MKQVPMNHLSAPSSRWGVWFCTVLWSFGGLYLLLILAMLLADIQFVRLSDFQRVFRQPEIRYAAILSLVSSTLSAILAIWVGLPLAFIISRGRGSWNRVVTVMVDLPIVMPPIVVGISLLVLFQSSVGRSIETIFVNLLGLIGLSSISGITFQIPAVILAQFTVAAAFATRTLVSAIDQVDPRYEQIARTLGASPGQVFLGVLLPQIRRGILAAITIAWARSIGEFGPILIFAGTTRLRTEVLPTSVFLELTAGDLHAAVAVSLGLLLLATTVIAMANFLLGGSIFSGRSSVNQADIQSVLSSDDRGNE